MSRISEMLTVLGLYPEFATSGVPFKKIAEECCRRIPAHGCSDGVLPADVLTAACEATIEALEREGLRGPSVANYIVATFKRMAAEGFNATDRLSRVGIHSETLEMAKLEAEWAARRAADAARPLPDPELPKAFLGTFPGRPDPDAWPTAGGVKRPALKTRPEPHSQASGPTRIGKVVDGDMMREERDLADANEQWRRT
jgi:hypothetical protein